MTTDYSKKGDYQIQRNSLKGRVQTVEKDLQTFEDTEEVDTINHITDLNSVNSDAGKPYTVEMVVESKPITMDIDTGSCMSIVSERVFGRLSTQKLEQSKVHLRTYSGHPITVVGEAMQR